MIKKYIRFFIFACICFIIADFFVNADTYNVNQFSAQLYDNTNGSLSSVNTTLDSSMGIYYGYVSWSGSNASGGAWGVSSPVPLIANHTYSMTVSAPISGCGTTALSSYNRIGVGTTLAGAVSSYQGNSYVSENYSRAINNYMLQFVFTPSINGSYIVFPYASSSGCNGPASHLDSIVIDDLGSGGVSETTINSSLNNQTNIINSSIQSTEQNIINNQNENQEKTNELLGNCYKNLINLNNVNTSDSNSGYRYPVSLTAGKTYTIMSYDNLFNFKIGASRWSYTDNEGTTSSIRYTFTYTPNSNNSEHYLMVYYQDPPGANLSTHQLVLVEGNYSGPFINYNEQVCSSKLDDTNQAINDVNDTLNDDDTTGATDEASDFFSSFSTDTFGLTSIITAPLNLIQSLTSSTCTALHIPLPYLDNKYIDLPCMTSIYENNFGSFFTMYQTITFGIIAYWVCVRIFNQVKDFKNPEHDEIEVLDL